MLPLMTQIERMDADKLGIDFNVSRIDPLHLHNLR